MTKFTPSPNPSPEKEGGEMRILVFPTSLGKGGQGGWGEKASTVKCGATMKQAAILT
ncbi:MAG: hypothetical protein FOGNACKC_03506 [Anaerolineae bacterium]|nr:hypothetical protein [Anaerolineae bacterium]